jgi:hypothetical protein
VVLSLSAGAMFTACAPRMNKTHFARWEEQDQRRREEAAAEEKVEAWMRQQAGVAPADAKSSNQAPASTPRMTTSQTTNQGTADTPPITRTSTRSSRVIKPAETQTEQEEEAIY